MKRAAVWLLFFLAIDIWAQAQPRGGRVGTFTYTAAQGMASDNITDLSQLPDGSVVAKYYSSAQLMQVKATLSRALAYGTGLKGYESAIYSHSGRGLWVSPLGALQLRGDSLQLGQPKSNLGVWVHLPEQRGSVIMQNPYQNPSVWWLRQGQWIPIPLPENTTWDSASLAYDLYTGLPCLMKVNARPPLHIYRLDTLSRSFRFLASYPAINPYGFAYVFGADSIWLKGWNASWQYSAGGSRRLPANLVLQYNPEGMVPLEYADKLLLYQHRLRQYWYLPFQERLTALLPDAYYGTVYAGTNLHLHRLFPFISTYPALYSSGNSQATHTLMQTADGTLYAGAYAGHFTQLHATGYEPVRQVAHRFLPGGVALQNQVLYFSEDPIGLYAWQPGHKPRLIGPGGYIGYYLTYSADSTQLLAGFGGQYKFGISDVQSVLAGKPQWQWVDSSMGMRLHNVVTLCEDQQGRIWFGRNSQGWGVYDRRTRKAQTWLMSENQTSFGALCSVADWLGHVFMGGTRGLWWAQANRAGTIAATDMRRIQHPLLADGVTIGAMRTWRHYLVIGAGTHMLLLDLVAFKKNPDNPRLLLLHPYETNFSSGVEQNAMLKDATDQSLWVATSDMVYRIDLAHWLQQKRQPIQPVCQLIAGKDTVNLQTNHHHGIAPDITSIDIIWPYQPADNLPRYVQTALVAEGDSVVWSEPSFATHFTAQNKRQGAYTFHLRILQHDGTITEHQFPITIRKFLWQQWWFWLLLSMALTGAGTYLLSLRRKKQLAEARARQILAEAEALRSEQQRQLTTMQINSLSNQFRPHFILNALNTVGARLTDKPEVDAVLGQLGESIGIIFKNAQQGSVAHSLQQEWRLVQSVIDIKQMEYRHAVHVHWPDAALLQKLGEQQMPMGIAQIPVENALVHGLRNKQDDEPKQLWLSLQDHGAAWSLTITDNGAGRKAAAAMSHYRSNGVGSKNLLAIIDLLNQHNTDKITYTITDDVFGQPPHGYGTRVVITIPKNYQYAC